MAVHATTLVRNTSITCTPIGVNATRMTFDCCGRSTPLETTNPEVLAIVCDRAWLGHSCDGRR